MKPRRVLYEAKYFKDIREIIANTVKNHPDNIAFKIKNKKGKEVSYTNITYTDFQNDINKLGTALMQLGFKDKRIAVIGKNRYEWAVAYYATLNGLGIAVPLDKGLPEEEIESLLKRSKANAIVFDKDYAEIMKKISDKEDNQIQKFICMDSADGTGFDSLGGLLEEGQRLLAEGNKDYLEAKIDEEKLATILFTSGTTSISKAAMLSHKNYATNVYDMNRMIKFLPTDVSIAFLPFHHTLGSTGLLMMLAKGATNVFCDGLRYVQDNLKEYEVSVFVCVPLLLEAMYKKIMITVEKQGKTKLIKIMAKTCNFLAKCGINIRRKVFKQIIDNLGGKLRVVISGASAIDKDVAKGFNDFGIFIFQGYGLTETAPVLSGENITAIRYGSCGLALPSVDIKIDNPNEEGIGEIIAKGPNVMLGYYENEEATKEVLKDGWFYTGDLGKIDKEGFLYITGRKKNVIVLKNGKNIYPEEIELLVSNLPYVAESMVFGKPKNEDLLLSVKIVYNEEYVKEKYPEKDEEELKELIWKDIKKINEGLPTYKKMKNLVITKEPMVKTTTQKVKRFEEIKKEV